LAEEGEAEVPGVLHQLRDPVQRSGQPGERVRGARHEAVGPGRHPFGDQVPDAPPEHVDDHHEEDVEGDGRHGALDLGLADGDAGLQGASFHGSGSSRGLFLA
jgi:hypothetical protein